jgi:hypothetical protein
MSKIVIVISQYIVYLIRRIKSIIHYYYQHILSWSRSLLELKANPSVIYVCKHELHAVRITFAVLPYYRKAPHSTTQL